MVASSKGGAGRTRQRAPRDTYVKLARLLAGSDYFAITTNVDHQLQKAGGPWRWT